MIRKTILTLTFGGVLFCGRGQGIHFDDAQDWKTIQAKAQKENKFILVDCYASWCGPCKAMDKDVYPLDSVGDFVNTRYVAVKIQLDSTGKDDDQVKHWYTDAHYIGKEYSVNAYPTYLFFSPDGKLVHRSIGYKDPQRFMGIVRRSLDPEFQYYVQLEKYRQGGMPYDKMAYLAGIAQSVEDEKNAAEISGNYINNFLLRLDEKKLYTREHLQFIIDFIQGSKDKAFEVFYRHGVIVDTVMGEKDFSRNFVDKTIANEEISPSLRNAGNHPDWKAISRRIKHKYNREYAGRTILWAQVQWYEQRHDWPSYCNSVILKVKKYGPYCKFFPYGSGKPEDLLNFSAWEIFQRSTDTAQLKLALDWSKKATEGNLDDKFQQAQYLDTYANLLYKLGRVAEACSSEEKAMSMTSDASLNKEFTKTLTRMKNGEPTWPKS